MGCDNTSFLLKMQVFNAKLPTNSLRLLLQYTSAPSFQNKKPFRMNDMHLSRLEQRECLASNGKLMQIY